ncbi:hypothetical protein GALMADRAFT_249490 [Galerina marginata CBS 339.88]|uniref:Telomere replication protein EST3 n=1 Tax=Galerina marginata (strain CBS 339.88) TaxID=685588 RepID=A0A067T6C6_GALM3|nr:hypothetical protein GALMADRAFT_249490 [Galerina marginata CBS 339.88]
MADSLIPWISDYLIDVAENFGAKLSDIPTYNKKKKVQIIRFLTYGSDEDILIWTESSDKNHVIPIKFTKEAVSEYRKNSGGRITQHRGAIAAIRNFRPIFTPVPLGGGLTSRSFVVLECTSFSILGCTGEGNFGNPQPITNHPDIQLWSEGLSHDGGAGNILKDRKLQRESGILIDTHISSHVTPPVVVHDTPVEINKVQVLTTRTKQAYDLASYVSAWQITAKTTKYVALSGDMTTHGKGNTAVAIVEDLSDALAQEPNQPNNILSSQPDINRPRARSATPFSNWGSSPSAMKENSTPIKNPKSSMKSSAALPSSIPSPTPGQRTRAPVVVSGFSPDQPSSYPSGNETVIETSSPDLHSQVAIARRPVPRKIPRPTSPEPPKSSEPERILAPNSDTSGTQSQSQSQPEHNLFSQAIGHKGKTVAKAEEHDAPMDVDEEQFIRSQPSQEKEATKRLADNHGQRRASVDDRSAEGGEDIDGPRIVREEQHNILGAVNMNAEDAEMDEEYPWLDLWQIKAIMARTMAARWD